MVYLLNILSLNLPFSRESIRRGIESEPKLVFIWILIFAFILVTVIILCSTIYIRNKKNKTKYKTQQLNEKYHQFLSELASGNYEDKALELMSFNKETTLALGREDITTNFNRKTLLKELLTLQKELAGEAAFKLREVYLTLGYKEESLKKLRSSNWMKRVEGIQELKQMDIKDGYQPLFKLVNDKNPLVRLEAILARMKMDIDPIGFFKDIAYEINDWEQLRIHRVLCKIPIEDIPSFLPLIDHDKKSVQEFGIKMIALFNQSEAEEALIEKLEFDNNSINTIIIESLAAIGTERTVIHLHENYNKADSILKVSIIAALKNISGEDELNFFESQLIEDDYNIQLAAAEALVRLGESGEEKLNQQLDLVPVEVKNIIEHARQWTN